MDVEEGQPMTAGSETGMEVRIKDQERTDKRKGTFEGETYRKFKSSLMSLRLRAQSTLVRRSVVMKTGVSHTLAPESRRNYR